MNLSTRRISEVTIGVLLAFVVILIACLVFYAYRSSIERAAMLDRIVELQTFVAKERAAMNDAGLTDEIDQDATLIEQLTELNSLVADYENNFGPLPPSPATDQP